MSLGNPNDIDSYPPIWPSQIFNTYLFQGNNYLTRQQADLLYASIYSIRNIHYLNDVTEGIVSPKKAVITDLNSDVSGFRNITQTGNLTLSGATSHIYLTGSGNNGIDLQGNASQLKFTGAAASILMSGINSSITMAGTNSDIIMTGTNAHLELANTEASTNSNSGAIRCQGGAYFGNNSLFNSNLTLQGASSTLTLSGANSLITLTGANSYLSISNSSASTSSTTGALRISGGAYFGNNSLFNNNITTNGQLFITRAGQGFSHNDGTINLVSNVNNTLASIAYFGTTTNHDLMFQTNNTGRMSIFNNGNIEIYNQLTVGTVGTGPNRINFKGTTSDSSDNFTVLAERIYETATEKSELIIFKGNDIPGTFGPDRVRIRTAEFKIQTYTSVETFATLADNNDRFVILNNGNCGIGVSAPAYQLELPTSGTGINTSAISFNGVGLVQSYYLNITPGVSAASKALVMDASNKIGSIGELTFKSLSPLVLKTVMRASTIANSNGIEFLDSQLINNPINAPLINFKTVNNERPIYMRFSSFTSDNTTPVAGGMPFDISFLNDLSFTAGLRISCTNTTAAPNSNYNIVLAARNNTIPHLVVNDAYNQLHLFPQNTAEIATDYVQEVICGEDMLIRKSLCLGASQDTSRFLSALDPSMLSTNIRYITFGKENSSKNQAELAFYFDANNSDSNRMQLGFYGVVTMNLTAGGRCGIGTSTPRAPLDVVGTNTTLTIIPISTITYRYDVSNNVWTNLGGGPVTIPDLSAIFNGNIFISKSVYTTSDRRLKENIKPIDMDLEIYKNLNPVSYNYIGENKTQLGFIAQDMFKVCSEAITYTQNEKLKIESENDIEGIQLGLDYKAISVLNASIIKKLIGKIEVLERKLENLESLNKRIENLESLNTRIENLESLNTRLNAKINTLENDLDGSYVMINDIQDVISELHPNINFAED